MGYYVSSRYSEFHITNYDAALAAIRKLVIRAKRNGKGFTWVDSDSVMKARTIEEALKLWGWNFAPERIYDPIEFIGEKMGDDRVLFDTIAPFVRDGSYLELEGSDGAIFRWNFKGGEVIATEPNVIWPEL